MEIYLVNAYGVDKHKVIDRAMLPSNAEYAGSDIYHGKWYDCYMVPYGNGFGYSCVAVEQ